MRQVFADIRERIDDVLAVSFSRYREVAVAHRLEPRAGRQYALGDVEADLAPLVDGPDAVILVRLIDRTVVQLEAEPLGPGLLQQTARLSPRLLDIGPVAGELLQLFLGGGERRAGEGNPADGTHDRD